MRTDPLLQEAIFFFYLVVSLYMKSGRHETTLFAKITEMRTHYTSSKCSSRIQLGIFQLSPRGKQQNGPLPYEGGKQFQEIYI